ncbi:hypothetical protein Aduo_012113 [Ancylostoma duodenale]
MRVEAHSDSDGIQYYAPAKNATGDGLVLVIMNPIQRRWLTKYGGQAVCFDDTLNLTAYSPRLATIIVADERDNDLLAGYLLSYWMTAVEVATLFSYVKKQIPLFCTDFYDR